MVSNSINKEDLIPFNKFLLLYNLFKLPGKFSPDISSEISKFPPAGQITSEHGS